MCMCEFAPLKSLFESALAFGLSGTKSRLLFKLITTKNNKKEKYSSRQICTIKLINTLALSLSSFILQHWDTKKAPFLRDWGECVCCCPLLRVCVCVSVHVWLPEL